MKKILIFSHALEIGGAERALLGLLHSIDYKKYQVDLFLMRHQGELFKYIPKEVNVLPEIPEYTCLAVPIMDVIKKKKFNVAWGRLVSKVKAQKYVKDNDLNQDNIVGLEYSHKYTLFAMPKVSETEYDLAISFLIPHYFVAERINAKKKIAWIHTDYSQLDMNVNSELEMWSSYDYIASISEACTNGFCKKFPSLKSKIVQIDNIISPELIKKQAEIMDVSDEMPNNCTINILSVGRFCYAKNFDNVPEICKRIVDQGINVKWYLIGFGSDEPLIKEKIEEYKMQNYVIILGKKNNPYPYMKACDIYIQPSRYEGNCVSVHEAQVLGKPVIITKYATSKNQLNEGYDGMIVPMDNEGCADAIIKILKDKELINQIENNVYNSNYDNAEEINKIYKILEL